MTAAERRASIIAAAVEEFTRVGYQGATISGIAELAGCSEPNLYKHFRDKRGLLLACLDHIEQVVEVELDRIAFMPDPFLELFRVVHEFVAYRQMLLLRMLCSTLPEDDELLDRLRGGTERLQQRFATAVERGKGAGRMPADLDAHHVGWTWLGISLAACQSMLVEGPDRFRDVMAVGERYLARATGRPEATPQ
jgi:AcrR family transcriptional regulator